MKKSKIALLSLGMALCIGGGIGAAYALTRTGEYKQGTAEVDKVISLFWGSGNTKAEIPSIETISPNVPQYRFLAVTPKSSKSVSGTVTVSFALGTIAKEGKTAVYTGMHVDVFKTEELLTDANVEEEIEELVASPSLTATNASGSTTFTVSTGDAVHETNAYYAIRVMYDGTEVGTGNVLSAKLTISQSFAASAE